MMHAQHDAASEHAGPSTSRKLRVDAERRSRKSTQHRAALFSLILMASGTVACAHLSSEPPPMIQTLAPSIEEREALFKRFSAAFGKKDIPALYQAVTPDFLWSYHDGASVTKTLHDADSIAAHFADQQARFSAQRFYDVTYYHVPDRSFMTFHVSETVRADGSQRDQCGVEIYTFRGGRIATKDVYRKPCTSPE